MEENIVGLHIPGPPMPEDRFTWATDLCPHPEYWTSTDGDSTEVEVSDLAYGLVRALQPECCLETGTGWGQTALRISQALRENRHGTLITLDPEPERAKAAVELLADYSEAMVVEMESLRFSLRDEVLDFAWLDSYYEYRVPEFHHYRPWMRVGTIVCFHDSAPEHGSHRIPSGRSLREEIEHELANELRWIHLPTPRGITIGEVK